MLSVRCLSVLSVCMHMSVCPVLSVTFMHCGQTVGRIKTKLGVQVGLGPGHIVLAGPAPLYCSQTAGWMKLVLGMEVGLSPGDFVLDEDPVPFPKREAEPPPQFSAHFYCGQTALCIKMPLGTV